MITMKLDKDRIAKIKSNVEVDLEFSSDVVDRIRAIADDVMTENIYKATDITCRVTF